MSASSWQPGLSSVPAEPQPVYDDVAPPGPPPPPLGREIAWSVGAGLVIAVLGAPLGLLWAALAPDVPVVQGENGPLLTSAQPEQFVAADAWYTFLGVAFGILIAIGAWFALRRYRGAIALAGVTLGAIGAAIVAWKVGRLIGLDEYEQLKAAAAVGDRFTKPADLRAGELHMFLGYVPGLRGDLLAAPLAAAATYTLLAGWSRWPSLRPEPEPPFFPAPYALADPSFASVTPDADVAPAVPGAEPSSALTTPGADDPSVPAVPPAASPAAPAAETVTPRADSSGESTEEPSKA
ncbi:DUF2567 domain-containing protein [Catenuloplanes japonicus]|uniref:DUF2567 domain-containing protein n=1 Tax=Catenuloplanes japonicus TaxID=33876 RepID=UPI00069064D8|nr:DUF2567 domain-containing protein [Catenuloplanes japonicus]